MSYMFANCESLENVPDISKWDTKNVKDMSYMFSHCKSLKYAPDISKWEYNTECKIENIFEGCNNDIIPQKFRK